MEKPIPLGSQTVGPYFTIGLEYLIDRMAEAKAGAPRAIEIRGRVLDRDGAPVLDAMLEFWTAAEQGNPHEHGIPDGFGRVATDLEGTFAVRIGRPVAKPPEAQRAQAPHAMVLVFARGLLRHLITRVYLEDEPANDGDPVLLGIPAERRGTLVAKRDGESVYRWNVVLQGAGETVFFAW